MRKKRRCQEQPWTSYIRRTLQKYASGIRPGNEQWSEDDAKVMSWYSYHIKKGVMPNFNSFRGMTVRTLKKKSKQALEYLPFYEGNSYKRDIFMAERGENYHGMYIRCPHKRGQFNCECSYHPLKGTPMTGGMSGGYESEWSEDTIFSQVREMVYWSGRPDGISDKKWNRLLRITKTTPITEDELKEMMK